MQLRMWMLDVAREQSPTLDHLRRYLDLTRESGFNAIGLYLEHRFAYHSTPWSHGQGCLTPEMVRQMQEEYPDLQIVPFINLLGHFEGMLYTEHGKQFREETFKGLQACPCNPGFVELCHQIIDDTVAVFSSNLVHIGGDETQQLGVCPTCQAKVELGGKAKLYGEHFGPLARKVQDLGRRPALWGDMFLEHPEALEFIPKEALIFDWQYFKSPLETSRQFVSKGFEVVCSPALLTYNALWCHLSESEQNVRDHAEAAQELGAHGVCVTTWECGLFGNYETLFPAIRGCGEMVSEDFSESVVKDDDRVLVKRLSIDPTAQLPDDPSDGLSVVVAVCDSIFINAIGARTSTIDIRRQGDCYGIVYDGRQFAELPFEQGEGIVRRLALLSDLNIMRPMTGQHGRISGTFEILGSGEAKFEYTVQAEGGTTPDRMVFTSTTSPRPQATLGAAYAQESPAHEEWARLMSDGLQALGGMFAFGQIRSSLKCRLLLYSNPFLAWMHHHEELSGEVGDRALAILAHAIAVAPTTSTRGVAEFGKLAIAFIRYAEESRQAYANGQPGEAITKLTPCRQIFEQLERIAVATSLNIGGSRADIERCRVAKEHVERVIRRIKEYGDGSLGYLPAFEILTHPKFMPHDQASWWLINRWANE